MNNAVLIYVRLPEEETPTSRPTQAIALGNGLYKLLPIENYAPDDEVWEFLPGSVVHAEKAVTANGKEILLAVEQVG